MRRGLRRSHVAWQAAPAAAAARPGGCTWRRCCPAAGRYAARCPAPSVTGTEQHAGGEAARGGAADGGAADRRGSSAAGAGQAAQPIALQAAGGAVARGGFVVALRLAKSTVREVGSGPGCGLSRTRRRSRKGQRTTAAWLREALLPAGDAGDQDDGGAAAGGLCRRRGRGRGLGQAGALEAAGRLGRRRTGRARCSRAKAGVRWPARLRGRVRGRAERRPRRSG